MATIKSHTDIEQSRKLAEILPLESADMWWLYITSQGKHIAMMYEEPDPHYIARMESYGIKDAAIRCWSLAALLDVIKKQGLVDLRFLQSTFDNRGSHLTNVWCCTFEDIGTVTLDLYSYNPVYACVAMIEKLNGLNLL